MQTRILGFMLLTALIAASPATAADDARAPVLKAPAPPPVVDRWTGAYFGGHFGWGRSHVDLLGVDSPGVFVPEAFNMNGGLGGVQLGATRQFGHWVFGAELSLSRSFVNANKGPCFIGLTFNGVPTPSPACKSELDWLALGTARLGYAHDSWMVYAIAGWAMAGFSDRTFSPAVAIGSPLVVAISDMRSGPAVGVGVEVSLASNVSASVEYVHVSFANGRPNFSYPTTGRDIDIVRGRLNFWLGRDVEPSRSLAWLKAPPFRSEMWTGAYFGLHAGFARGRTIFDENAIALFDFHDSVHPNGGFAGAQLGVMKQFRGDLVLGAELSLSDAHVRGSNQNCFPDFAPGNLCQTEVNWLLLGLARAGFAFGNLLPYGTAGAAVAGVSDRGNAAIVTPRTPASATTIPGIAYGGGIEANIGNGVIAGVEYLHVNLDDKPSIPALGLYTGAQRNLDLIRARLNVRTDQCCGSGPLGAFASAAGGPANTWSGVYVGAYGGYGWGRERHTDSLFGFNSVPAPVTYAYDLNGGLGGLQIGVNRQFGQFVFGGEVSLGGGDIKGSLTDCVVRNGGKSRTTCTSKVEGLLTAMARGGFASDSWLIYATGGWAVANTYFEGLRTDVPGVGPFAGDNTYASGPAFGGGFEYALGNGVAAGVEYLRANLGVSSQPFGGIGIGDRDLSFNLVRGRLNVKIN